MKRYIAVLLSVALVLSCNSFVFVSESIRNPNKFQSKEGSEGVAKASESIKDAVAVHL